MDMREVLVILGVVLIAVILWDGLRRMKSKKANRYHGGYTQDPDELKKQAELARELPNGGARVRHMTEEEKADLSTRLNLRERVPMLMDSVEEERSGAEDRFDEPTGEAGAEQRSLDFDTPVEEPEPVRRTGVEEPSGQAWSDDNGDTEAADAMLHFSARDEDDLPPDPDLESSATSVREAKLDADVEAEASGRKRDRGATHHQPQARQSHTENTGNQAEEDEYQVDSRPVEELVIMHVMAPEGESIAGSDLLETLLRAGLRFGPLDIFHYRNPKGQLEFSLANCVQPGTLDPDTMEQMTTPGVTLFMQLPLRADMMEAFDHMYEMAMFLARHLDAELLDEEHSTVTPQRVEHYRERLRNFARSQLIQAH